MFTKNIKLIVIVAVALIVAILVSCLVAVNNDKKAEAGVADTQTKIDELNKTIASLNAALEALEKGLADAEDVAAAQAEVIKALEAAGVKLEGWNAATSALLEKLEAYEEIVNGFVNAYDESEVLTLGDVYDLELVEATIEGFYAQTIVDLARATSVEEMDAILAKVQETLDAIPTRLETLYANIEAIEADGIVYEDGQAIADVMEEFYSLNGNVFAPATEEALGEKEVLAERLAGILLAWRGTVADAFVAEVAALPTFWAIVDTDGPAVESARMALDLLKIAYADDVLGYEEIIEREDVAAAIVTLNQLETRVYNVKLIKERADMVNALLNPEFVIGANVESHDYVRALEAAREAWANGAVDATTAIVSLAVITDAEDERFNETIYNYVNHEAIDAAVAAYEAAVAQLVADFQAFIDAVEAIGEVTLESEAALDAALEAYITCLSGVTAEPAIFDILVDAEAESGLNDYYAEYHALRVAYNALVEYDAARTACINKINAALHALVTCTDNDGVHTHGTVAYSADLADKLAEIENMIARELLAIYEFDVEVLNKEYFAFYYEAQLVIAKHDAIANIEAIFAAVVDGMDTDSEIYKELVVSVATQTATVNSVTLEKYDLETALAKVASYGADDFVKAQFDAIINQ